MKITFTQKIKLLGFIGFLGLGLAACGGGGGGGSVSTSSSTTSSSTTSSGGGALPDLVVTITSSSSTGTEGGIISFGATVTNQGTADITVPYKLGLYFSNNNTITTTDSFLGFFNDTSNPAANGGTSLFFNDTQITLPTPLTSGTYYIGAIVDYDNLVTESNDSNNVSSANPITVSGTTSGLPDLISTITSVPSTGTAGGTISVATTVTNQGTADVPSSYYAGIYLSTDSTITTADTNIYYWLDTTNPVASGGSTNFSYSAIPLPSTLATGTYYIGAIADDLDAITESNESNNVSAASAISITAAGSTCTGDGNDTIACATIAPLDATGNTSIYTPGDVDYYKYTMTSSNNFYFSTSGTDIDTVCNAYNSAGTVIATNDDGGAGLNCRIGPLTVSAGTIIYIAVNEYGNNGTGNYSLIGSQTGLASTSAISTSESASSVRKEGFGSNQSNRQTNTDGMLFINEASQ